jgi:hypothetical protein
MKKYIREMIDDLRGREPKTTKLDPPPEPVVPEDLSNQILSEDPLQRTRQLDYQAQRKEEGQG